MDVSWFYQFPALASAGLGEKFQAFVRRYPPGASNVAEWNGRDILEMIEILGLQDMESALREQEFIPDDEEEESPFGSLDPHELDEIFQESDVPHIEVEALKVALRYLKGHFTNVSVRA